MARPRCPHCHHVQQGTEWYCPQHGVLLNAPAPSADEEDLPAPGWASAPPASADASPQVCGECGAAVVSRSNSRCTSCNSSLRPAPVVVRPRASTPIALELGSGARIGRCPRWSPHAAVVADFPNVSRRHATVHVDDRCRVWITPERTPNGTFVNGCEIPEQMAYQLKDGDEVGLAKEFRAVVRIRQEEGGDPS
ncbi:FHA domain-containing protein [Micromonospora arida]|uniref:FHA domain-containing protein n=1 Tax=Micromonospora arida TaxID=2203715 RepID=UPI003CF7B3A6